MPREAAPRNEVDKGHFAAWEQPQLFTRAAGGVRVPASMIFDGLADGSVVPGRGPVVRRTGDTASGIHLCAARIQQHGDPHMGTHGRCRPGTDQVVPSGKYACEQRS